MFASRNHDSLFTKFTKLSVNKSQSYGICYTFAVWNIGVDSYYENVTLVHCSVAVCIHVLPFLLYLKEYVVISNTVLCYWQERWGLQAKPIAKYTCSLIGGSFTQWSLSDYNKVPYMRELFVYHRSSWAMW